MKTGILIFALLTISQQVFAQKTKSITGVTVDSANGKRIPFATVSLINKKQVIIKTVIADSTGQYRITDIPRGNYNLSWSPIGYRTFVSRELTISNNSHSYLGELAMKQVSSTSQFYQEITNRYQTMFFWISATWKFGRKEVKAPVIRQGAVEE